MMPFGYHLFYFFITNYKLAVFHLINKFNSILKTENDVCIMQLDLGNLDGIRNYCILTTTEKNLIYFSQDFVNNDIRDYEKASRVMERSFG